MSYPPIMVRQWPFDGYSRQPVELHRRLVESRCSSVLAMLASWATPHWARAQRSKPRPIAPLWPVQMRSRLGQKRLLDTLNAESKRSASRSRSAHRGGGVGELLTGGRHQARSAILHKEPSHPGAFRRYGSRRL